MPAFEPITLQAQPWLPDTADFGPGGWIGVNGVLPLDEESYGPWPSMTSYGVTALAKRVQGAIVCKDKTGVVNFFTGTTDNLFRILAGATSFTNVSKSAAAYHVASDEFWSFTQIKDRLIATNIGDAIQTFTLSSSSAFADLSSGAPKAKYCAGVKQFLMVANTNDATDGFAPWRTWWSAIGDPTNWPTPGSSTAQAVQSDYNDLVGDQGEIHGIVGNLGTADGALFFEHAVWRINYVGGSTVFDFFPAEGVRGCPAPQSIAQLGAFVYYLGEDGFYVFDGTTSQPIGAGKVDKTFFADLSYANIHRVVGAIDPVNRCYLVAYPGANNTQGNPNHIMAFHWPTGRWAIADVQTEYLFRALAFGYTLESLDAISGSLDALPYSLDSAVWAGGNLILGAFDTSHNLNFFNGSNMAGSVTTEESQPFNGQRSFIRNTRPLIDGGTPSVSIGTRDNLESAVTYTTASAMNSLGWCPQRTTGRYFRAVLSIPAATTFTHLQGVQIDCDPIGVR